MNHMYYILYILHQGTEWFGKGREQVECKKGNGRVFLETLKIFCLKCDHGYMRVCFSQNSKLYSYMGTFSNIKVVCLRSSLPLSMGHTFQDPPMDTEYCDTSIFDLITKATK